MASLDNLIRWQPYAPDLGENRRLPKPFFVLLAVGLTKRDLQRLTEALAALDQVPKPEATEPSAEELIAYNEARAELLAKALYDFVRLGAEPLSVNGEPIDSLSKLLKLYAGIAAGGTALLELATALRWFNGAGGNMQLFYERLSGGLVSTDLQQGAAR